MENGYTLQFETLWVLYPKKVAKGSAFRAWRSATKRATPEEIWAGLERQLPEFKRKENRFVPHLATWLNADRWLDEDEQAVIEADREEKELAHAIAAYHRFLRENINAAAGYLESKPPHMRALILKAPFHAGG
jgi:hypothetical protein